MVMPCELVADCMRLETIVAISDGEVQCDGRVAAQMVGFDEGRCGCGSCISGAVPCELIADRLGFDAGIRVIDGKEECVDVGTNRTLLSVVVSVGARCGVVDAVPAVAVARGDGIGSVVMLRNS